MKTIKVESYEEIPENFTGIAEYPNKNKSWYKDGELHRPDGPACEWLNGTKFWCKKGKYHRLDGPAVEMVNGNKEWWLEDQIYPQINLQDYIVLDHSEGEYGIMWYKLLDKDKVFEWPDIPGLIEK